VLADCDPAKRQNKRFDPALLNTVDQAAVEELMKRRFSLTSGRKEQVLKIKQSVPD
jgi:hypothetical protein